MSINQKYIKVQELNIYCEVVSNGKPPLLLLHGFASSTYTFHRLLPLLAQHFSVYAIDLPGFGRSEKSKSFRYSFKNYASLVRGCLDYFQLEKVSIVAHSMGGQIALYTAKMVPDKIDKLVLLCSSGYLQRAKKALICCSYLPFFSQFVKWYIHRKDVKEYLQNVFYDHSLITNNHIKEFEMPLRENGFYKALVRLLRYREGDLTSEQLREITVPVLLIWGKEDRVVPVHIGNKLEKDLPNATLVTYNEAGHLITEERPTEVFQQILTYTSK